ncbi:single-pass membrane and coiled-coil domain-containing protein 1 isoform X2 [Rhinatrema bivittatum]|uniref:single-pass membrane and coiled-coil domain-containing protein 1 isoform X2 n=1 Tax=Rhinatrema bivittatum TaxID=194408 RepID=UPI001127DAFD|nr:single-pass membrane and coiled-coil domain-containing protein 1 isoform X2 [Rhinatrema bivittatum]
MAEFLSSGCAIMDLSEMNETSLIKEEREERMTKESISLRLLSQSLNRLENRMNMLEEQFNELQCAAEELTERLEIHGETLVRQANQDEMWTSVLEDRFTTMELNVFYSYATDLLSCLHSQVIQKLPGMAGHLPTLASILKHKSNSEEISQVWEAVLEKLGLQEDDVKALCTFFITHYYEAKYCPATEREQYVEDISALILKVVKNHILKKSLLCAVQLVEKGKTESSMDHPKEKS